MRHLPRIQTVSLVLAGLALVVSLYGPPRVANVLLVVVVILNGINLEALRAIANRENHP